MKILEMTATFGCLDRATLQPQAGLNLLVLPNESGKSTWAAFLLAMFYGVETSQRASKGFLPDKVKYQPWSGAAMEGVLTLEHQGRIITLQRTSRRGRPMADFRAWDKNTGLELPGLTGENCGQTLLGVERSVFWRSAYLSGDQLTVTKDESLARRLENLAVAGDESDSFPAADSRLRLWKNRCHYNQTGLLPEAQARLRQVHGTLEAVQDLRRQRLETTEALAQCRARAEALERQEQTLWRRERDELGEDLARANGSAETLAAKTAALPTEEELRSLLVRLETAPETEDSGADLPPALRGLDAEALLPKAQRDVADYETLSACRRYQTLLPLCAAVPMTVGGLVTLVLKLGWQGPAVLLAMTALFLGLWGWGRKQNRLADESCQKAQEILDQYGAKSKEDLWPIAVARRDWLLARERNRRRDWDGELVLEEIRRFAPEVQTAEEARGAVEAALDLHRQAGEAQTQVWLAESRHGGLAPRFQKSEALQELQMETAALEAQAKALAYQELALGDWEKLWAKAQSLEAEIAALRGREQAIALAQEALRSANDQLAQVYAPQLTGLAGEYLSKLTLGRYDGLILQGDFTLLAREQATGFSRPLAALSRGAQDQTWLALRLAMTRLLLPDDAPILLDDVFLTFDRERRQEALAVLAAENRQILLFSCQSLE